ncbi:FAD-dependent oxidoreductase, partial [Frateuria aurantia]
VTDRGSVLTAEQIVIAAGSAAQLPQVPGIELPQVHTSDTVMRIDDLPERVLVVGGGVVAAEFASLFAGFGAAVTQLVRGNALLRAKD